VPLFSITPAFAAPEDEFPPLQSYWWDDAGFDHPELTVSWDATNKVGALAEGVDASEYQFYDIYIGGVGEVTVTLELEEGFAIEGLEWAGGAPLDDDIIKSIGTTGPYTLTLDLSIDTDDDNSMQLKLFYKEGSVSKGFVLLRVQRTAATAVQVLGAGQAQIVRKVAATITSLADVRGTDVIIGADADGIRVTNQAHYTFVLFKVGAKSVTVGTNKVDLEADIVEIESVKYNFVQLGPNTNFTYIVADYTVDAETPVITTDPVGETYWKDATPTSLFVEVENDPPTDGGTLSYTWFCNGTEIAGATTSEYLPPTNAVGTFNYYVKVTNTNGSVDGLKEVSVDSETAVVVVKGFVPVTDITLTPLTGTVGTTYSLTGAQVVPATATSLAIVWTIEEAGTTAAGATLTSLGTGITVTGPGVVKAKATIKDGTALGTDFTKIFDITFNNPPPPLPPVDPPPGGGTTTPPPDSGAACTDVPAVEVTPTVAGETVQEEAEDAVADFAENWASDVEQVGPAIAVKLPKQEPSVVTLASLPEDVNPAEVTVMAILNDDGTLTPVPTRIIGGKIVVVLHKDATLVPLAVKATFGDLSHVSEAVRNEILKAASLAIVEGFPGGDFKPSEQVTVQQAVAMFLRAAGIKVDYATALATGVDNKIIADGMTAGAPMSRIQTAQLLVNVLVHFGHTCAMTDELIDDYLATFPDVDELSAAERKAMASCVKHGIFKGHTDGTMRPTEVLNRSQMASLAVRVQEELITGQ